MAKQHLIEYFKVNQENVKPIKLTENTKVVQQGGKSFP